MSEIDVLLTAHLDAKLPVGIRRPNSNVANVTDTLCLNAAIDSSCFSLKPWVGRERCSPWQAEQKMAGEC